VQVLIFANHLLVGGAELLALDLCRRLSSEGSHVVVAAAKRGGGLAADFASAGAVVYDGLAPTRTSLLAPARVARIIKRHDIRIFIVLDVIRTGMFALLGSMPAGRKMRRILWAHTVPGLNEGPHDHRFIKLLRAAGLVDQIVCVSNYLRDELRGCGIGGHIATVHNGIDVGRFRQAPRGDLPQCEGKRVLVCVANFMPHKDHRTLLLAAGELAKRRDDFALVLAGRGTDSPELARLSADCGAAGVTHAVGTVANVAPLMKTADVFVLATLRETFGLAVVEAMAAGRPVVTTDAPAFKEIFTHGKEGLKTPLGNSSALAAAIECVLDDQTTAASMAAQGIRRAELFSNQRMLDKWMRLLRYHQTDRLGSLAMM